MRIVLTTSFLLFTLILGKAQNSIAPDLIMRLDRIATQDVPEKAPGIATAIIQNGRVIYKKCAGYADFADSSLITNTTRFNIASNGKQFTALAILSLIERNKLNLTDDIRKYFPSLYKGISDKITIQSLLNHTSGIRDCYDLWSLQGITWWEKSFSNEDVLKLLEKQTELNFTPDTQFLYSNTNYILLALLIEKVSGKPFVDYTNQLFKQLNMPNTSFESDYTQIRGPIARSYFNFGTWSTYDWIWNVCGDGNLFSTLEDQIQWEKILQDGKQGVLSRDLINSSQHPIPGTSFPNYGFGLEFGIYKGMDYTFHEGVTGAWKATVIRFPREKTSMITLTNTGKSIPSMQTRQMADVLFGLKNDKEYLVTKPARIGKYFAEDELTGTYLTDKDFAFQFEKKDHRIYLKRIGRNDVELEREADNIFHQKYDPDFKQEFTVDSNGILKVTAYYVNHAPYTLVKQIADFTNFNYHTLNGKYLNAETETQLEITYNSDSSYSLRIGKNDHTSNGILISTEKVLVDNYTLNFDPTNSKITTLYLNGDRIKRVQFTRVD